MSEIEFSFNRNVIGSKEMDDAISAVGGSVLGLMINGPNEADRERLRDYGVNLKRFNGQETESVSKDVFQEIVRSLIRSYVSGSGYPQNEIIDELLGAALMSGVSVGIEMSEEYNLRGADFLPVEAIGEIAENSGYGEGYIDE